MTLYFALIERRADEGNSPLMIDSLKTADYVSLFASIFLLQKSEITVFSYLTSLDLYHKYNPLVKCVEFAENIRIFFSWIELRARKLNAPYALLVSKALGL